MDRLTVLYDEHCSFCRLCRDWVVKQAHLVPLEFLAAGSAEARRRYPDIDPVATLRDVTVVADNGAVYCGPNAWVVILWALSEHRPMALKLAHPRSAPLARAAVAAAGQIRLAVRTNPDQYGSDCDDKQCG
ncbi:hypothetical protein Lfu02_29340 [Longispora fulva]|uniref:Putative DCC family thiol-disulfide oxidoreductase YuxK n=1 Tax=Longispora fulva TaxID=619741 RepID=A0A8J7KL95_9ACTN|nr:DCC1-like thiol-disulfide oxidoreductase family protein [Longispora fulva]MBG6139069.1 putative DCC family thiol-disulfide oxidoreductase YuxK [Longispora fulva]GIG58562.1 hypothetical protein Lfu02_29340 [Longispora fulva]